MLVSNVLTAAMVPPSLHDALFELLWAGRDFDGLARMCLLDGLDDTVDARLGRINEPVVEIAWARKPGRTPEELDQRLGGERRADVLAEIVTSLTGEQCAALLACTTNSSIAVAVLASSGTPWVTQLAASRMLGARYAELSGSERLVVQQAWATSDELADAALVASPSAAWLGHRLPGHSITEQGRAHVHELLAQSLETIVAMRHRGGGPDRPLVEAEMVDTEMVDAEMVDAELVDAVCDLVHSITAVMSARWCRAEDWDQLVALADRLARSLPSALVQDDGVEDAWATVRGDLGRARALLASLAGGGFDALLVTAATADSTELDDLLTMADQLRYEPGTAVYRALLGNPNFSVDDQRRVADHVWCTFVMEAFDDGVVLAPAAQAALELEEVCRYHEWSMPLTPAAVDLLLEYVDGPDGRPVVERLVEVELTSAQLRALPMPLVRDVLAVAELPEPGSPWFGTALARELSGAPRALLEHIDTRSATYSGTIGELLDTCRAEWE